MRTLSGAVLAALALGGPLQAQSLTEVDAIVREGIRQGV